MPSSVHDHISDAISIILQLNPSSFLDVGCGFGRWGFLTREALEIPKLRYGKDEWRIKIDAIEIFKEYISPHHEYIYNNIIIGNITEYVKNMPNYDVIFLGDMIEHLEKPAGETLIKDLLLKCNKAVIAALPINKEWPQGEMFKNIHESHLAIWTEADLSRLGASNITLYRKDTYAVAVWEKCPMKSNVFQNNKPVFRKILTKMKNILCQSK